MSRISPEVVEFIKSASGTSYSRLIKDISRIFGVYVGKSTISYYKRSRSRIKSIDVSTVQKWELEWLFGLYFADGSKFFDQKRYDYTIKFSLDSQRDTDIADRATKMLQRIGLEPTLSIYKRVLSIRVFSKELYKIFPTKSEIYIPKDIFAFVAGLIDGDGSVYKGEMRACIVQKKHPELMQYLMGKLKLRRYEQKCFLAGWGEGTKVTYYVPSWICKILFGKNYCVKLLRKINKVNN